MTKDQEEKELEIMKLRIDQQYQEKVEGFRKETQLKYEREKRLFEDEKQKRLYEIQDSIDDLKLASSDKQKMKNEIEDLIMEQNKLQSKIDQLKGDQDEEQAKNRQLEREINELNIQLRSNKLTSGYGGAIEDQRVQELRDDIAKK